MDCNWMADDIGRLNMGYLQDLFLSSIFHWLSLGILLIVWQVTLVQQTVEVML